MYTIYSKSACDYCEKAKKLLIEKGLPFTEIKLGRDIQDRDDFISEIKSKLPKNTTISTVPQIFKGDAYIGGFTELQATF